MTKKTGTTEWPAAIGADGEGLGRQEYLRFGQQIAIAELLGCTVSRPAAEWAGPNNLAFSAEVELPSADTLPELPARNKVTQEEGEWYFAVRDGQRTNVPMSREAGDAAYAATYLAEHAHHYSQPGAFKELFDGVKAAAESGSVIVPADAHNVEGLMCLSRQVAHLLGYESGGFARSEDGATRVMQVSGRSPGFDPSTVNSLAAPDLV